MIQITFFQHPDSFIMIYYRLSIFVVFCLLSFQSFSQANLNLSMKLGLLKGKEVVQSKNIGIYDSGSYEDEANSNVSLAFSLPIKGKFRLGAELGLLSFRSFLDYNFTYENKAVERFKGRYKINQAFVAIVPEYRITKWIYINGGAGLYSDFNSHFTSGNRTLGATSNNITGLEYKRSNSFGYLVGLGICPNITNELAVLGEIRFTGSPASIEAADNIGIGYRAFNFNLGLMFKPK